MNLYAPLKNLNEFLIGKVYGRYTFKPERFPFIPGIHPLVPLTKEEQSSLIPLLIKSTLQHKMQLSTCHLIFREIRGYFCWFLISLLLY